MDDCFIIRHLSFVIYRSVLQQVTYYARRLGSDKTAARLHLFLYYPSLHPELQLRRDG